MSTKLIMLSHLKILLKYEKHFLVSYHDWEFKENEVTDLMMKKVNPFFILRGSGSLEVKGTKFLNNFIVTAPAVRWLLSFVINLRMFPFYCSTWKVYERWTYQFLNSFHLV